MTTMRLLKVPNGCVDPGPMLRMVNTCRTYFSTCPPERWLWHTGLLMSMATRSGRSGAVAGGAKTLVSVGVTSGVSVTVGVSLGRNVGVSLGMTNVAVGGIVA